MDHRQSRRRAGFGDAAGASASGAMPDAAPVPVASEAQLRAELERVAAQLAPSAAWTQRVDALSRLEGLARGGAADLAAFPDLLTALLRDALAAQLQERRSAVSRQACHAVAVLATVCGPSFELLAAHLLPVLFKTLAMGITVVSECADVCAYALLTHCPSPRLLPKLLGTLCGDKNGRLRQAAADYLLCALESWHPAVYERQLEAVERAVLAAAGDPQAETRAAGRAMFAAYSRAWPAQASVTLARLGSRDRALQEKLAAAAAAAAEYGPGLLPEGSFASQPPSRRTSLGNSGSSTPRGVARTTSLPTAVQQGGALRQAVPKLALPALGGSAAGSNRGSPSQPSSARGTTARENQPENRAAPAVQATPRSIFSKTLARRDATAAAADGEAEPAADYGRQPLPPGRERLGLRRSLGGAALRMSVAAFKREPAEGIEEDPVMAACGYAPPAAHRPAGVQRGSLRAQLPPVPLYQLPAEQTQQAEQAGGQASRPLTARRLGALDRQPSSVAEESEVGSIASGGWEDGGSGAAAASLAPLLSGLAKPGVGWADKVSLFQSVQAALQQTGCSQHLVADVASNIDRLVAALLEGVGDAHFRVCSAALAALAAGLGGPCSRLFEPQLDRVMTALFARVVDPKEHIRQLVSSALAAVLQQQSGDATVAALARSLQANRAPKVKCAILDFFAAAAAGATCTAGDGGPADGGEVAEASAPQPLLAQLTGSAALPGLLRNLLQLSTDKNPDIRRSAAEAVAAAYRGGEAQAVLAAVHALPPADVLAVQRAIGPAIQQRGGSGGGAAAAPSAPPRPGSKAAASAQPSAPASRRQSSEGLKKPAAGQQQQQQQQGYASLAAHNRQGSQQVVAAEAAMAPAQQQQEELTPEPPSPFAWQSASPHRAEPGAHDAAAVAAWEPEAEAAAAEHALACAHSTAAAADQRDVLQVSQLAPFDDVMAGQLQRLLAQLEAGPGSEALQGLSRLAHVLPPSAWAPCFDQILDAVCAALDSDSSVLQDAALMLVRDLAASVQPSLFMPALHALLPRLLCCAADPTAREVVVAAEEALEQLLLRVPPQSCLSLLTPLLPAPGAPLTTDLRAGAHMHATVCSLRRVVARMQPAGLAAHLQPVLLPGLCAAYGSPVADVRKATVDCLVAIWQVVGGAITPHLKPLSASQMKLLTIYKDKAAYTATA